ncbi:MAG: hypothetical protein E6J20_01555 [Chloroflexi bacterium]|nr:MAG: hypothetical protein E6J20_01555 [Chloroflexota bacterium]
MSAPPPGEVGQLSPDGMWRWDGQRWVPTGEAGPPQTAGPRRTWIWWLAGGCALLLVIGVIGGIYGFVSLVHTFQRGGLSCLPSDFPRYPGASTTRDYTYYATNLSPGDTRECQEVLASNDDVATVTDFYAGKLSSGDWKITADDRANGELKFARVSRPLTVGVVDMLGRGQHTVIQIKLDS